MSNQTYDDFLKELNTLWTDENIMKVLDYMNVDYEYLGNEGDKVMTKIYYATSIATQGETLDSIRVANNLRQLGYEVYVASENKSINDKSNNPTPEDIFNGDIYEILSSDIFVVNLTGGTQDGTISEIGFVAGWNEANSFDSEEKRKLRDEGLSNREIDYIEGNIPIVAFTTNTRIMQPQHHHGVPSASANHLVLGMIDKFGDFVGGEKELYEFLSKKIE